MLRLALLLLCLPATALAQAVTFTHLQPEAGMVRSTGEGMTFALDMAGSVEGTVLFNLSQSSQEASQRVEAVRSWSPTRREVTVTYGPVVKAEVVTAPAPKRDVATNPVSGRSYDVVWTKSGGMTATGARGKPVSAEELEQLRDDMDELGEDDTFSTFLAGRSFTLGERLDVPREVYGDMFDGSDAMGVDTFNVRVFGLDNIFAVLAGREEFPRMVWASSHEVLHLP